MQRTGRRTFQGERTSSAKVQRWPVLVTAKRPAGPEPSEQRREW